MTTTFLTIMLLATLILLAITLTAAERLAITHHQQKVSFFHQFQVQPGDIVFLGDSITDGGRWHELFPAWPVKNRGINADTVAGVLNRLDDVTMGEPAAIFIMIGTNNLPWYAYHNDHTILKTYETILKRCKSETPATQVFVQSILPRGRFYARRVLALNKKLENLARRYGYEYINLHQHFSTHRGEMRPEFSNDRLHLLAPGYAKWVEIIKPYMDTLGD